MANDVIVYKTDNNHAVGVVGDVFVLVWKNEATKAAQDEMFVHFKKHADLPGGVSLVVVIEKGSTRPTEEMRKDAAAFWKSLGPKLKCAAAVIEGSGLASSIFRSVLTGFLLVVRPAQPHKVFAEVPEALQWICSLSGGTERLPKLNQGVNQIRSTVESKAGLLKKTV